MKFFKIDASKVRVSENEQCHLWEVGFGEPGSNTEIVEEVDNFLGKNLGGGLPTGGLLLINGRCSVPLAFTIAHRVAHVYSAIGVFDPKENVYVVCVSHSPLHVGSTLKLV